STSAPSPSPALAGCTWGRRQPPDDRPGSVIQWPDVCSTVRSFPHLCRRSAMSASPGTTKQAPSATASRQAWTMLIMATIGFAVNFWAWALLSPLGPLFRQEGTLGDLTEGDVALLVAVPVVVGSLGRIVVGALTDRYGGRAL